MPTGDRGALKRLVYPTLGDRPISRHPNASEIIRLLDKIAAGELTTSAGKPLRGRSGDGQPHPGHRAQKSSIGTPPVPTTSARQLYAAWREPTRGSGRASAFCQTTSCERLWQSAEAGGGAVRSPGAIPAADGGTTRRGRRHDLAGDRRHRLDAAGQSRNKTGGQTWSGRSVQRRRPCWRGCRGWRAATLSSAPTAAVRSTDLTTSNGGSTRSAASSGWTAARFTAHRAIPHEPRRCQFGSCRTLPSATSLAAFAASYDRHEFRAEKLRAFEALAAQVNRIVDPLPNIVPMRG